MRRALQLPAFVVPRYNEHYEGAYDERALEWRRLGARDKAANLSSLLQGQAVGSVLEVGCGTGAVLAAVARAGIGQSHTGVDLADPDKHRDPAARQLNLSRFDGQRLPFEDGAFDLVYASHVIEHVPEPRALLAEMARVARRWVYVEVPCELHLRTNRRHLQQSLDIGHINAFTPESFRLLLETSELKVAHMGVFDHSLDVHAFQKGRLRAVPKLMLRRLLLGISPSLATRFFTFHVGALVTKSA